MNVQVELNKYGYRAENGLAGIDIYKNNEKVLYLSESELMIANTPEKTWELIKIKLNI